MEQPEKPLTATERLAKRLGRKLAPVGAQRPNTSRPKQSPENSIWTTMEKKQLILELQSLREAYARKIAETELKYEKKLSEVEDEAAKWLAQKKGEVTQIRAGMVVMQALFEQRKRKFIKQMEEDKAQNERLRVEMERRMAEAEEEMRTTRLACDKKVTEMEAAHAKELKDLDFLQRQTEERAHRAEKAVKVGEDEIARLHETEKACRFEIEDLRVRLQDAERAEELHRVREKVEFLEEELRDQRTHAEPEAQRGGRLAKRTHGICEIHRENPPRGVARPAAPRALFAPGRSVAAGSRATGQGAGNAGECSQRCIETFYGSQ